MILDKEVVTCNISFRNAVGNFTAVSNEFIQDKELSLKAKGLLLVILSNKENWRVYPDELARRSNDGLGAVKSGLAELEKAGYIRTYTKSLGRAKGIQHYRFCADRKISDAAFSELCHQLEQDFTK